MWFYEAIAGVKITILYSQINFCTCNEGQPIGCGCNVRDAWDIFSLHSEVWNIEHLRSGVIDVVLV